MKNLDKIAVIDFGSQMNQRITRLVREAGVYAELVSRKTTVQELKQANVKGLIFTSSPCHVDAPDAFTIDPEIYEAGLPILAIGYGLELMISQLGGEMKKLTTHHDSLPTNWTKETPLLSNMDSFEADLAAKEIITKIPEGFEVIATSEDSELLSIANVGKNLYGLHFHPESPRTENGLDMLHHFLFDICHLDAEWTMEQFIEQEVQKIRETVGDQKVLLGLSGGVDSSVTGVLIQKAIGNQLTCIFVDHGLLRKNEVQEVMDSLSGKFGLNIIQVDAADRFLDKLQGITNPEEKRKIIGKEFIEVFDDEARKLAGTKFLAQGTIYTDIIESGTDTAETIKSHHNVGGLPEDLEFQLIEPLNTLFKDEVRALGTELGMPEHQVWRQPFPGPGLGVRVVGEVTREKLAIVRESDAILREEIKNAGLERDIWQYFTILPGFKSVGVRDDKRTYDYTVAIRAIHSVDGVTAEWARIPLDLLAKISTRITDEVPHVNRVVYDITGKPPATIEWE
nr:glutamine-hydrolyzing GMP synthase [Allofustis seminis]